MTLYTAPGCSLLMQGFTENTCVSGSDARLPGFAQIHDRSRSLREDLEESICSYSFHKQR